jgi:[histone H3]-lysine36 N-dimethyltransferase SETMAR
MDNAALHTSAKTMAAIKDPGLKLVPHPPYSSDLAPSNYCIFGTMKNYLWRKTYSNFQQLSTAVRKWLKMTDKYFFAEGYQKLPGRWQKCINVKGEYIEKIDIE